MCRDIRFLDTNTHFKMKKPVILVFILAGICIKISEAGLTGPGTMKQETRSFAEIIWNSSEFFNRSNRDARYAVYKGYSSDVGNQPILELFGGAPPTFPCCQTHVPSIWCVTEDYRIGFNISNIDVNNASRYSISVAYTVSEPILTNYDAVLYIYQTPTQPNITGNNPVPEGHNMTLTCYSQSLSLPEQFRHNESIIEYTWSGAYSGSGQSLTLLNLTRYDDGKSITCTAKDRGASDTLSSNSNVNITVYYGPSKVEASVRQSTVVEGVDDLVLICNVTKDGHGNPFNYTYYWHNTDTGQQHDTNNARLNITKHNLNVTRHEGRWQCVAGNGFGNSSSAEVSVTVNARPSFIQSPEDTTILVNQTLNVSCSFIAKPAVNVTWLYNGTYEPDLSTVNITQSTFSNGPYNITRSRMSWTTSDLNERKAISGLYTCTANNTAGRVSEDAMLEILYWPLSISFIGPGDTTDTADVIENTQTVNRTCTSDCNPPCSYFWINNNDSSIISNISLVDLGKPNRYDAGNYTCVATNIYGKKQKVFNLNVRYSPSVRVTTSNNTDILETNNITLSCDVDSNPMSDIKLYNKTDNRQLDLVSNGNKAEFKFINIHCLDTGEYVFTASNDIPDENYRVNGSLMIDVMCVPRQTYQKPSNGIQGVPLADNYTLEVGVLSNPCPIITSQNWTFVDYNGSVYDRLPDNVNTSVELGSGRLSIVAKLTIIETRNINYGNYTLKIGNSYGNMTPVTLGVTKIGPPGDPSAPQLVDATAVSITMKWRAGFNGGLPQFFTVVYTAEGSTDEQRAPVDSDPEVSLGDVVIHKLKDNHTIKANTTYIIKIQAENGFSGSLPVVGNPAKFTTLVKATFNKDPDITMEDGKALIHFLISGRLTHILEENCVVDTTRCDQANITVPLSDQVKATQTEVTHDFIAEVPLADVEATDFVFSFWMYDGEDLLEFKPTVILVDEGGVSVEIIVGVVLAVILAVAVVIMVIVLWKKGIFSKESKQRNGSAEGGFDNVGVISDEGIEHSAQHEEGTVTGETYAVVVKRNATNKPELPEKPKVSRLEQVYENIPMSEQKQSLQRDKNNGKRHLPFQLHGVDGTTYADLEIIGKPSDIGIIHGEENKVEYTDISFLKCEQ